MLVVMLAGITGTRDGREWPQVGGTIDLPDLEAADLVAAGYAARAEEADHARDEVDGPDPVDAGALADASPEAAPVEAGRATRDEGVHLDVLDRGELIDYAERRGIKINRTYGAARLRATIRAAEDLAEKMAGEGAALLATIRKVEG